MISAHIVGSLVKGFYNYKVELIAHTNITLAARIRMTIGSVFTVPAEALSALGLCHETGRIREPH